MEFLHTMFHHGHDVCAHAYAAGLLTHFVWDVALVTIGGWIGLRWARRCKHTPS